VDSKFEHKHTVRALLVYVSQGIPNSISKNITLNRLSLLHATASLIVGDKRMRTSA